MKHFHVYDTTGEVMCVDAADWAFSALDSTAWFWDAPEGQGGNVVATFNWSNVVCVREEEDDDEGDDLPSGAAPTPQFILN